MSDINRIALFASKTIPPFAPVPTFTKTDRHVGYLSWSPSTNIASMPGEGFETVLLWASSDTMDLVRFTAASALADALSERPVLFRFEANETIVCPRCYGDGEIATFSDDPMCPKCGGSGRVQATAQSEGGEA